MEKHEWIDLAEAYAFVANSLLAPMNQTSDYGLSAELWGSMPVFDEPELCERTDALAAFVERIAADSAGRQDLVGTCISAGAQDLAAVKDLSGKQDPVKELSAEWTHLFVGPPQPACPPWETYYRREGVTSGFGAATFEMQEILRKLGYAQVGSNNQFADHVGIQLLALSVMCRMRAGFDLPGEAGVERAEASDPMPDPAALAPEAEAAANLSEASSSALNGTVKPFETPERALYDEAKPSEISEPAIDDEFVLAYLREHLLWWIPELAALVEHERSGGYHALMIAYVASLLAWHEVKLAA